MSLAALMGVAVHEAIAAEVEHWSKREATSAARAVRTADDFLLTVWADRTNSIIEFRNGLAETETVIDQFRNASKNRLERFFRMIWPQFSGCRYLMHEKDTRFTVAGHQVRLRIDLACWDHEERLVIVDWKTGQNLDAQSNRDQLAVYALWAQRALGVEAQRIQPTLVSVSSGEVIRFDASDGDLEAAGAMVSADFEKVSGFYRAGRFPTSASPEKCWACPHLRKCEDGSEAVGAVWE